MGSGVSFQGVNLRLNPPDGREDVQAIEAFRNETAIVTAWEFTPEEIADINRTGKVFVAVMTSKFFVPIFVGSSRTTRGLLADYGSVFPHQPDKENAHVGQAHHAQHAEGSPAEAQDDRRADPGAQLP
jgi:hypothetical protein